MGGQGEVRFPGSWAPGGGEEQRQSTAQNVQCPLPVCKHAKTSALWCWRSSIHVVTGGNCGAKRSWQKHHDQVLAGRVETNHRNNHEGAGMPGGLHVTACFPPYRAAFGYFSNILHYATICRR